MGWAFGLISKSGKISLFSVGKILACFMAEISLDERYDDIFERVCIAFSVQ